MLIILENFFRTYIISLTTKIKLINNDIKFYYTRKLILSNNASINVTQIQMEPFLYERYKIWSFLNNIYRRLYNRFHGFKIAFIAHKRNLY